MIPLRLAVLALGALSGCGDARLAAVESLSGDSSAGATVFADSCSDCHGAAGEGGSGPTLAGRGYDPTTVDSVVLYGTGDMPAFDGVLTDQDIADVAAFVSGL